MRRFKQHCTHRKSIFWRKQLDLSWKHGRPGKCKFWTTRGGNPRGTLQIDHNFLQSDLRNSTARSGSRVWTTSFPGKRPWELGWCVGGGEISVRLAWQRVKKNKKKKSVWISPGLRNITSHSPFLSHQGKTIPLRKIKEKQQNQACLQPHLSPPPCLSRSYAGSLPLQERVGVGGSLRTSKTSKIGLAKRASSNASQLQVTESKLSSEGGQTVPLRPKTQ